MSQTTWDQDTQATCRTITITSSSFSIGGNAMTFPATAATLAYNDANGNVFSNAPKSGIVSLTATGTAAGSLSPSTAGHYVYNGTTTATYTLPAVSNATSVSFRVLNNSTSVVTIAPASGETINASTNSVTVATSLASATFYNDVTGTNKGWLKV